MYVVEVFAFFSAADMDDGEFRQMVLKDLLINLQQKGFDIDPGIVIKFLSNFNL